MKTFFTTETGSTYVFDADASTLTRVPSSKRVSEWIANGGETTAPLEIVKFSEAAVLRRDNEAIPVVQSYPIAVGEPATFLLNILDTDVLTLRRTSVVTNIRYEEN